MQTTIPCRLCGYDAPDASCRHCHHHSTDPSLRDERGGRLGSLFDGLRALPNGMFLLMTTSGVKRFLIPPVLLTFAAFVAMFVWSMGLVDLLVEAASVDDIEALGLSDGWFKAAVAWLLERGVATLFARISGVVLWILVSSVVALYAFSIVYEAIAGPFLDEIQGRIESRWFGHDPRDAIQRPTDLPTASCVKLSVIGALPALALLIVGWVLPGPLGWALLLATPTPFIALGLHEPRYGTWLRWVIAVEGHTLWVSIKASLFVGFLLLIFFPLKFVPVVGFPLFMAIAGFGTAITLLDIPFSRREWPLSKRLQFMVHNAGAVTGFGLVASLLFLIPIIGPLVMVPAASIGGLWLVVRLDKDSIRPLELRRPSSATVGPRD